MLAQEVVDQQQKEFELRVESCVQMSADKNEKAGLEKESRQCRHRQPMS